MPPARSPEQPLLVPLGPGSVLYRVHSGTFAADSFNFNVSEPPGGGRFDAIEGSYGHLYAGSSAPAAIAEGLVRRVPLGDSGRYLMRSSLEGVVLSVLVVTREVQVVQLHGTGLSRIGQTALLTACEAAEYGQTREWARRLREWAPESAGFVWRSRHDNDTLSYVFFGDRAEGVLSMEGESLPLYEGEGLSLVRDVLDRHGIVIDR